MVFWRWHKQASNIYPHQKELIAEGNAGIIYQ